MRNPLAALLSALALARQLWRRFRPEKNPLEVEALFYAKAITKTLTRLGLNSAYKDEDGHQHHVEVTFVNPILASTQWVKFQVDLPALPQGVLIKDLIDADILEALSAVCKCEVSHKYDRRSGLWYIVHRQDQQDALPDKFMFADLKVPEHSLHAIMLPFGISRKGQVWDDLYSAVGVLIGGAARQGKSNQLNAMICYLLQTYRPEQVQLLLVDLKEGVEFRPYTRVPHLYAPVVTSDTGLIEALKSLKAEGERRYGLFNQVGARNIKSYHQTQVEALPYIALVIDELAMAMLGEHKDELEKLLADIAARMPAAGINCILATQRPTVNVVTGLIKANLLTRVAMRCASKVDSGVILDRGDAADLPPRPGRCLALMGADLVEIQAPLISDKEIAKVVEQSAFNAQALEEQWAQRKQRLLDYAHRHLNGQFQVKPLHREFKTEYSLLEIERAALELEQAGVLSPAARHRPRQIVGYSDIAAPAAIPLAPPDGVFPGV